MKRFFIVILCGIMLFSFGACGKNTASDKQSTERFNENETSNQTSAVFNTENIKRITFYAYYGSGKGSDVPAEYLAEITNWLESFTIDKVVLGWLPPGTNTIYVEIEYLDGSIVKQGMDTTTVIGLTYYIKGDTAPECYEEIISKTSLN